MGRKSVAVLDIRSTEVTALMGQKGVNQTFIFKASKSEYYDGYENGAFYDVASLSDAILRAITSVEHTCGERIKTLYIGVPGEFCRVEAKEQDLGFPSKRKIGQKEIKTLISLGGEQIKGYRLIRTGSMVYITADNRRIADPIGLTTTGLTGILSYYYCSEYFAKTMEDIFSDTKVSIHFLPATYAMAEYLISSETRDEYALFLDTGYLSSTICALLGNGVFLQQSVWAGSAHIISNLMGTFSLPYDAAVSLLSKANLYSKDDSTIREFNYRGETYEIQMSVLIEQIKAGLDGLCEALGEFLEECSGGELDLKPIYVTGDGVCEIRGALEHISKRLNRVCELLTPKLPYYNKPSMSSRIALVDMACEDHRKSGFLYRLLNGFGG